MSIEKNIQEVYFIGIGGIGMSAIARYYHSIGVKVSGYDKTQTVLTKQLQEEGIEIHFEDNISIAPKHPDFVIYTPAIPSTHSELNYYQSNGFDVLKRSDVLKKITADTFNICIAGTHGKTTITTMVAHILRHTEFGCTAFLGGISANYNTNFWSQSSNGNNTIVVEADEYDKSFLKLSPNIAIITAVDADHLDIYGTAEEVENAFIQFSEKIQPNGCLILKHGLKCRERFSVADTCTYSVLDTTADIHITELKVQNGSYQFNIINQYWQLNDVILNMGGLHNIENVLAAVGVAKYLKIDDEKIKAAVAAFKGVKRRFEYILNNDIVLIDDYAHHPEELKALILGARSLFAGKKMTVIFQPHLFSRTNDLADGFAASLDLADEVILLPIYPARELPMEGVTSKIIFDKMGLSEKHILDKEEMLQWVKQHHPDLCIMAGAGDIDVLVNQVKNILQ